MTPRLFHKSFSPLAVTVFAHLIAATTFLTLVALGKIAEDKISGIASALLSIGIMLGLPRDKHQR